MTTEAHGSFAFEFRPECTLITASESWNLECIKIYDALIQKRMESQPDLRRCVIIDGRTWGFQTPECFQKTWEMNQRVAGYYKSLHIAYVLSRDNLELGKHLVEQGLQSFKDVLSWQFFQDLKKAVSWLNSEGFEVPDLTDADFPKPIPASHYLEFLKD